MLIPTPKAIDENLGTVHKTIRWARSKASRDHISIHGSNFTPSEIGTYGDRFYTLAAVAPSRRLRHPEAPSVSKSLDYLRATTPVPFDPQAVDVFPDVISFETPLEAGRQDPTHTARIYARGLVELKCRIMHWAQGTPERVHVDLVETFEPLAWLLRGVESGEYQRLFDLGLTGRWRRLDWYINVTPYINGDSGSVPWEELRFVGQAPGIRGKRTVPWRETSGLAHRRLARRPSRNATTAYSRFF